MVSRARKASLGISTIAATASSCSHSRRGKHATHGQQAENIGRSPTTTPGLSASPPALAVAVATARRCLYLYGPHQLQGTRGSADRHCHPEDGAARCTACGSL